MFQKTDVEALFAELERDWRGKPEFDRISREAHLGIALCDAGRPVQGEVDQRVAVLIDKYKPKS